MACVAEFVKSRECSIVEGTLEVQESLPLFTGDVFSGRMHSRPADCKRDAKNKALKQSDNLFTAKFEQKPDKRTQTLARQDHLACAKRLSRAMQRIPVNSRQHIQAGRLVCHHLVAMLHDSPTHNVHISSKLSR